MVPRSISVGRIGYVAIFLTLALAGLSSVTGVGDPRSLLFGGAFSALNLRLIRMLVSRLIAPDATTQRLSSVVTTKFLLVLALLAVALKRLPIDAASFLVGGGTLFVAIVLEAVLLGEPIEASDDDGNQQ